MFDINDFKKKIKQWLQDNPKGDEKDLLDYCEELIPAQHYAANKWLVDQTVSWFLHIKSSQKRDFFD